MKVFVAGAGGYIGMVLCKRLLAEGHEVTAFDRYFFGHTPEGCHIVRGDTRTVTSKAIEGHDAVVDLAGLSNDASCEIDPAFTKEINLKGGRELLIETIAAGVRRYVYASSASVYGHGESLGLTEEAKLHPLTYYARSKVGVEDYIHQDKSDMEKVILRNATVFGVSPRMRFDLAVNVMTMRAWRDRVIYVMGGGEQWRPFIHVEDVARAIIWALTVSRHDVAGKTFNVGFDEDQLTIHDLAKLVKKYVPAANIHQVPDFADNRSYHLSFRKFKETSGLNQSQSISGGICQVLRGLEDGTIDHTDPRTVTLNWYKSMLEWKDRLDDLATGGPIL